MKRVLGLSLLLLVPVSAHSAGNCDVVAELAGEVIVGNVAPGTVAVRWRVWDETDIRGYHLFRYPAECGRPSSCSTRVARVGANRDGARGTRSYEIVDTAPAGTWRYRLAVRGSDGRCTVDGAEVTISSPPPCDLGAVCMQVEASLAGEVIIGNVAGSIELEWLTHAEEAAGGYRLSRSNCRNARTCSTEIAIVDANGACGSVQLHRVHDDPPAGNWTYHLEVLDSTERTACAFDLQLPGPVSTASSR